VRSDALTCEDVAEILPALVDGDPADRRLARHVDGCLRCQAELVQYRKLLRAMHTLRTEVLEPASGLFTDILAHLEAAGERRAIRSMLHGRRGAYIGGLAAATAAGAAGAAIVLVSRRGKRVRLAG
jgi:hypothetical protein